MRGSPQAYVPAPSRHMYADELIVENVCSVSTDRLRTDRRMCVRGEGLASWRSFQFGEQSIPSWRLQYSCAELGQASEPSPKKLPLFNMPIVTSLPVLETTASCTLPVCK